MLFTDRMPLLFLRCWSLRHLTSLLCFSFFVFSEGTSSIHSFPPILLIPAFLLLRLNCSGVLALLPFILFSPPFFFPSLSQCAFSLIMQQPIELQTEKPGPASCSLRAVSQGGSTSECKKLQRHQTFDVSSWSASSMRKTFSHLHLPFHPLLHSSPWETVSFGLNKTKDKTRSYEPDWD